MAERSFFKKIEGTGITLNGKDEDLLSLTAVLAAPGKNQLNSVGKAETLAVKLHKQDLSLQQVQFVQEKKGFKHPSEAASWLLESNNKLILYLWEQDEKGGPVQSHTS
jgi:hypothetical protein